MIFFPLSFKLSDFFSKQYLYFLFLLSLTTWRDNISIYFQNFYYIIINSWNNNLVNNLVFYFELDFQLKMDDFDDIYSKDDQVTL